MAIKSPSTYRWGRQPDREAAEKLSVAGHIRRKPALIRTLSPEKDFVWGLGSLALTNEGRVRIKVQTGVDLPSPEEQNTQVALEDALADWLDEKGLENAFETIEKLRKLGEEIVRKSGASVSPFVGSSLEWISAPESDDPERWREYISQLAEQFATFSDYADNDLGVQLITMKTRSRPPQLRGLIWLFANRDPATDVNGEPQIVRNSHVSGLTPVEMNACVVGAREGLARFVQQWDQISQAALRRVRSHPIQRAGPRPPGAVSGHCFRPRCGYRRTRSAHRCGQPLVCGNES